MKKLITTFSFCLVFILGTYPEEVPLTIFHTNDIHAHLRPHPDGLGGVARIAAFYKKQRDKIDNTLFLDAGDMVSGTPVSSMFQGEPIFHVLNHWKLDAAAIGNHEFDYGWEQIETFRTIANFPLLCANASVIAEDGTNILLGDAAYRIFEFDKFKVAVLAIVAEWTPEMTVRQATEGVHFVNSILSLRQWIPKVEDQADIIIVLSHVGHEHDEAIASHVEGIDLIIGAHSHRLFKEIQWFGKTPMVQAGSKGRYIGRIDLTFDTEKNGTANIDYEIFPVTSKLAEPDPATQRAVDRWEEEVSEMVDRPLGVAKEDMSKMDMLYLANAAFLEATGADYSHQNTGGTRGGINKGSFTYREIWNIFPFENTLVTTQALGKNIPEFFYGFEEIQPDQEYKIVTNSYVRDQWDNSFPNAKEFEWKDTGRSLRDSVLRYIEKRRTIKPIQMKR